MRRLPVETYHPVFRTCASIVGFPRISMSVVEFTHAQRGAGGVSLPVAVNNRLANDSADTCTKAMSVLAYFQKSESDRCAGLPKLRRISACVFAVDTQRCEVELLCSWLRPRKLCNQSIPKISPLCIPIYHDAHA